MFMEVPFERFLYVHSTVVYTDGLHWGGVLWDNWQDFSGLADNEI